MITLTRNNEWLTAPGRTSLPVHPQENDGFIVGETEPTWLNSGCRLAIAQLTRNETTELVTSSDGQVISGLHLPYGKITVAHKNVVIRDCVINIGNGQARGLAAGSGNFAISTSYSATDVSNLRIEYVTIDPINAGINGAVDDYTVYGIAAKHSLSVWRCAIRKVTDAVNPDGYPSYVYGSYLATRYLAYSALHVDGTHNDGIQLSMGGPHYIMGNALHNFDGDDGSGITTYKQTGQCIVLTPYRVPLMHTVDIIKNWAYGGFSQFGIWPRYDEGGPGVVGVRIVGNRHGVTCKNAMILTPTSLQTARDIRNNVAASMGLVSNAGTFAAGAALSPLVTPNSQGSGVPT